MGYQALVFCPDEKTARTVTQVLTELEFAVEACTEPFAAVKKLMGQHFDAIVVDCDNEQNATLLFKSARNSSSNQTSLAVAVVEGQAGVAKAFRIGANLVLTKPINIEQAKGTVRVARGLLRKSEPGKTASPSPAPSASTAPAITPAKPLSPKPLAVVKPAAPVAPKPILKPVAAEVPVSKPAAPPAWPAPPVAASAPAATSIPVAKDIAPLEIELQETATPAAQPATPAKPAFAAVPPATSSGAASAPAPARIPDAPSKPEETVSNVAEKPAEHAESESASVVGSTPSFSFGGVTAESESKGGNKKVLLGVAAAVVVAAVAYFGWTQFQSHPNQSAPAPSPLVTPAAKPQPAKPSAVQSSPAQNPVQTAPATSVPAQEITLSTVAKANPAEDADSASNESVARPATNSKSSGTTSPGKTPTESAPLMVKSGKAAGAQSKAASSDAPAPSLIGLAAPGAMAPPDLGPNASSAFKPTLQTLNISQGVSQGLLIKKVSPAYPPNALRMHIEGSVELLATVSKDGNISHIKVLSGDAQLTRAASDAVKQWKYKPYLLNGEPVDIQTQVTINFRLPK
jgi:periplasmic protein TonB